MKNTVNENFPGGSVVKNSHANAEGPGSIPGQGTRSHILHLRTHMPKEGKKERK